MIIKEIMSDMNDKMSSQFFDGWIKKVELDWKETRGQTRRDN